MRKLLQSSYDADPRFARGRARHVTPPRPAPAPREFRYVEPRRRKVCRREEAGPRSGLAYAAGYAGLAYLSRQSALTAFTHAFAPEGAAAFAFVLAWGLSAPAAVVLGLLAAHRLDRAEGLKGRLPALTGFTLGVVGTIDLLVVLIRWLERT